MLILFVTISQWDCWRQAGGPWQCLPWSLFATLKFHLAVRKTLSFPTETTSHHSTLRCTTPCLVILEITKILPVLWCSMGQSLPELWAGDYPGPNPAELPALLLCLSCSCVQILFSKWFIRVEKTLLFSTGAFVGVAAAVLFPGGRGLWEALALYRWAISLICRMICTTRPRCVPLDAWEGRLCTNQLTAWGEIQQLSLDDSKQGWQRVEPTSEQMALVLRCSQLSRTGWDPQGSYRKRFILFLLTVPECSNANLHGVAQISSILVPFWEKLGAHKHVTQTVSWNPYLKTISNAVGGNVQVAVAKGHLFTTSLF